MESQSDHIEELVKVNAAQEDENDLGETDVIEV